MPLPGRHPKYEVCCINHENDNQERLRWKIVEECGGKHVLLYQFQVTRNSLTINKMCIKKKFEITIETVFLAIVERKLSRRSILGNLVTSWEGTKCPKLRLHSILTHLVRPSIKVTVAHYNIVGTNLKIEDSLNRGILICSSPDKSNLSFFLYFFNCKTEMWYNSI